MPGVIDENANGSVDVKSNVIDKSGAGYDYNSKLITWKILINDNKMSVTGAVVTDNIPKGLKYVSGSAKIIDGNYSGDLDSATPSTSAGGSFNEPQPIDDSSAGKIGDSGNNGTLTYKFPDSSNSNTYTIMFQTELVDLSIFTTPGNPEVTNSAYITGEGIYGTVTDSGSQTISNPIVTKTADHPDGKSYINWTLDIAPNNVVDLSNAIISDTLQEGLSLNTDSVELYNATVNSSDGTLSPIGDKIKLTKDNVKYDPDTRLFEFTFPDDSDNKPFVLKFVTNVTENGTYANSVTFKGKTYNSTNDSGYVKYVSGSVWVTGTPVSIKIVKSDSDNSQPLSGAVFQLLDQYGNVKATSSATVNDGSVVFDGLLYDTDYYIKEITAPTGYNLNSTEYKFQLNKSDQNNYDSQDGVFKFDGSDSSQATYNYRDTVIRGNIQFTKTGEDADEAGLNGAVFGLYKDSSCNDAVKDSQGKSVTAASEENGRVTFSNVPYGTYYIKEIAPPTGYNPSDKVLTAAIGDNDNGKTVDAVYNDADGNPSSVLFDNKIRGNIQFKKTDQSGNPLKGAVFTLYRIGDDGKTLTAVKDADGKDLTAASGADDAEGAAVTTGNVIFSNIEYGSYVIKETEAPPGYYLSSKVLDASITADGSTVYARPEGDAGTGVYSLSDTKIPGGGSVGIQGTISVKKTDDGGNALSGAVFTLYNDSGNPVQTATTDAGGTARFTKVQPGKYTVKETTAPAGYVLSSQVIPVEINMSKTYDIGTVKDTKNAASIEVKKTDASGNPLSGAKFTLYNSGVETASAVSGQDGIARFDNVVYGSYTIKETAAPAGYDLNGKTLSVNVDSSKTYQFTVVDEKGTPNPNNPGGTPNPNNPGGTPNPNNPGGTPNPNNPGGTPNPSNPGGTPSENISKGLPKTGSMVDTAVLLVIGMMAVLAGIWMMMRSKRSEKNI
ncbi:SpaA isopeptide-forming pilin-related protein [Clostridium sp. HV4-5-A1G]|uniref:SpaA isopeptide-forming pilin-related protein n=1 Tax=Clostridium sp. HV4-5-A1G TaxID=2004595 RepID=UPI0012386E7E|nr:SpaA isopeptide-forming pilin-related protein [Clostridium sp. HV4-5-A1G]KAA8679396.1 LPXTG cell wall anchor domain-containing protein [Clostridium sp. HV4-5-A1G]